jgi:hypothetical protein
MRERGRGRSGRVGEAAAEGVSGDILPVAGPGDATLLCGASSCGA